MTTSADIIADRLYRAGIRLNFARHGYPAGFRTEGFNRMAPTQTRPASGSPQGDPA